MINAGILGRLVADPETKDVRGTDIVQFTVAVNHNKNDASFVRCSIWDDREHPKAFATLKKGTQVYVMGTGKLGIYETRDGSEKASLNVTVKSFDAFLPAQETQPSRSTPVDMDDMPF